jgi:hypothetical protein
MKRHIIDHIRELGGDEWLVIGKGPSFDEEKSKELSIRKIGINQAANIIPCDIAISNDWALLKYWNTPQRAYALPSFDHYWNDMSILKVLEFLKNAKDLDLDNFWQFDLYTNKRSFLFEERNQLIHAYNSTYESVLWLLGYAGVRKIITTGIDFGTGGTEDYHPKFLGTGVAHFNELRKLSLIPIEFFNLEVKRLEDL